VQVYDIGEPRQLTSTWYDANGVGANPATITLTVTHPDGTVDTYLKAALTQGATTADWFRWVTPDANGVWRYDFVGTVDGFTVEQGGAFLVGEGISGDTPCEPWCSWDDVSACGTPPTLSPAAQELVLDQATEILFNLNDRKYPGLCTATRSLCFACFACFPEMCSCVPYPSIDLGGRYPVWAAYDVVLDGVTLAPSAYRIRDRRWLVRTDGEVWPMGGSSMEPDSFRLTWVYGRPVPLAGRVAAATFAFQIAKLCAGDKTCQLPQRVTNVQREGVSYTLIDSMAMVAEGRTGLPLVDLWLAADAKGSKPRPHIYHPMAGASSRMR